MCKLLKHHLTVVEKNHVREQIEGRAIYSLFLNRNFKDGSLIGFLFSISIEERYWIVLGASGIGRLQRNVLELHSFLNIRLSSQFRQPTDDHSSVYLSSSAIPNHGPNTGSTGCIKRKKLCTTAFIYL